MRRALQQFLAVVVTGLSCLLVAADAHAQTRADSTAIRQAVLDYVEGFYEGDTTKLVRSIVPAVAKYGFSRQADSTFLGEHMPWPEFLSYANKVKARGRPTPATAPKVIKLLDIADQTASAKLTAWWGIDYLLLGKFNGRWMITHVLWQSPPKGAVSHK